jgi:hypothetical protein
MRIEFLTHELCGTHSDHSKDRKQNKATAGEIEAAIWGIWGEHMSAPSHPSWKGSSGAHGCSIRAQCSSADSKGLLSNLPSISWKGAQNGSEVWRRRWVDEVTQGEHVSLMKRANNRMVGTDKSLSWQEGGERPEEMEENQRSHSWRE